MSATFTPEQAGALRDLIRAEVALILKAVSPALASAYEREVRMQRFLRGPKPATEASPQAPEQADA